MKLHVIIRHNLKGVETMKNRSFLLTSTFLSMLTALFSMLAFMLFRETWQMVTLLASGAVAGACYWTFDKMEKEETNPEIEKFCRMMGC